MNKKRNFKLFILLLVVIFTILSIVYTFWMYQAKNINIKGGENNYDFLLEKSTEEDTGQRDSSSEAQENKDIANKLPAKQPIKAKAIYLSGCTAGTKTAFDNILKLIKETELNAVVIDIKDESGKVNYKTDYEEVVKAGAYENFYNPQKVIEELHKNNIYVIGRIVCFKDPALTEKRIDLSIKNPKGGVFRENGKTPWANPYNREVWNYNISIAKDAIQKGFDEIQFDYVRFPAANKSQAYYGENVPSKADIISGFLEKTYNELHNLNNTFISADVFGIVCESKVDAEAIGQKMEQIVSKIDYICPMIYPSHYANASKGAMGNGVGQSINGIKFTAPDLKPYDVVYNTLLKTKNIISNTEDSKAVVRPYLQDFTASYLPKGYYQQYGAKQVRQQIQAVYDAGFEEWILWDSANTYTESALIDNGQ